MVLVRRKTWRYIEGSGVVEQLYIVYLGVVTTVGVGVVESHVSTTTTTCSSVAARRRSPGGDGGRGRGPQ